MNLPKLLSTLPLAALLIAPLTSLQAAGYVVTDLGPGTAVGINNSGVVALNEGFKAFRVTGGVRQELRVGRDGNFAMAINDAGNIAGEAYDPERFSFLAYGESSATGSDLLVRALNDSDLVGGSTSPDSSTGYTVPTLFTVPWTTGTFVPALGSTVGGDGILRPNGANGEVRGLNDAGVAVGTMGETSGGFMIGPELASVPRAFRFHQGQTTYLDQRFPELPPEWNRPWGFLLSAANAINEAGQVVGEMAVTTNGPIHAFRHVGAGLEDLGTLGGDYSTALDINDGGSIVGESTTAAGERRAFLWHAGVMTDLNTLLPAGSGMTLLRAKAINNLGQIVGDARVGSATNVFVLSPEALGTPPRFIRHPQDTSTALGTTVLLSVEVFGLQPFAYQWEKAGEAIVGATGPTLELTDVDAFDQAEYRVVVTNAAGRAVSQPATLAVLDPGLQAHQLVGLTLQGALGASYRIEATSTLEPLDWQTLTTVTLTNSPQWWVDFGSTNLPQRTYRAIRLP